MIINGINVAEFPKKSLGEKEKKTQILIDAKTLLGEKVVRL